MTDVDDALRALIRTVHHIADSYDALSGRSRRKILGDVRRGLERLDGQDLVFPMPAGDPRALVGVMTGIPGCTGPRPMGTQGCELLGPDRRGDIWIGPGELADGVGFLRDRLDQLDEQGHGRTVMDDLGWILAQLRPAADWRTADGGPDHGVRRVGDGEG